MGVVLQRAFQPLHDVPEDDRPWSSWASSVDQAPGTEADPPRAETDHFATGGATVHGPTGRPPERPPASSTGE